MADALTSDDPRFRTLFNVADEAMQHAGRVEGNLTPAMNALRERGSVLHGSLETLLDLPHVHKSFNQERDHWSLLSWKNCERAFRENELFSSQVYIESPGVQSFGRSILEMTGAEHRRYRGVVQPMFLRPRAIKYWRPQLIEDAVSALMERIEGQTHVDLNTELCARLPVYVVTRMMGLDGNDALHFREHLMKSTQGVRLLPEAEVRESASEVARMLRELIAARRLEPRDDVISALAHNDLPLEDGAARKLTDDEVFGYVRLIMFAGGGTTWRQLGITLWALMTHYPFWEACRDDRKLIEPAIEEGARWLPTDPTFPRLMMEDVELDGVVVPKGARVDICVGSANRDPARWDNPDAYDIFRKAQYHIGFGLGPHQCLGMNVAKQEMVAAIEQLMDRFPNMVSDPNAPAPEIQGGLHQRGMTGVPVILRP